MKARFEFSDFMLVLFFLLVVKLIYSLQKYLSNSCWNPFCITSAFSLVEAISYVGQDMTNQVGYVKCFLKTLTARPQMKAVL